LRLDIAVKSFCSIIGVDGGFCCFIIGQEGGFCYSFIGEYLNLVPKPAPTIVPKSALTVACSIIGGEDEF
jgi:hypothetical protein